MSNWIKAKDKLPEHMQRVIVTWHLDEYVDTEFHENKVTGMTFDSDDIKNGVWVFASAGATVTHWQPLPDAPS